MSLLALLVVTYYCKYNGLFICRRISRLRYSRYWFLPTVLGPKESGSGSYAFKNWIGTISCPWKL